MEQLLLLPLWRCLACGKEEGMEASSGSDEPEPPLPDDTCRIAGRPAFRCRWIEVTSIGVTDD